MNQKKQRVSQTVAPAQSATRKSATTYAAVQPAVPSSSSARRSRHIDTAVLKVDAERVGHNAAATIDVIDGG